MRNGMLALACLLASCSVSPIKPMDNGLYAVTANNYMGWSSGAHETVRALDKADQFCMTQSSQGALLTAHTEGGVPALTNLSGTVIFKCVAREDPNYRKQQADLTAIP